MSEFNINFNNGKPIHVKQEQINKFHTVLTFELFDHIVRTDIYLNMNISLVVIHSKDHVLYSNYIESIEFDSVIISALRQIITYSTQSVYEVID